MAKIRARDATEMYNVITDENQLAFFLEEGLNPEHLKYKDQIISFFTYIKDRISIEDLIKISGVPLPSDAKRKKNKCSICKSFANINCISCLDSSTWLCVDHWKDHRLNHISAGNKADNFLP